MLGAILVPVICRGQKEEEEGKSQFPLDNFYAKLKKNPRSLFKNFRFGFSLGYGNTFFSHQLNGYGIYQATGQPPTIFDSKGTANDRYSNWVNKAEIDPTNTVDPGSFLAISDTTKLGFKGNAMNIPFKATLHYEFLKRYRIGGGYSYELMNMGSFHSISYQDKIGNFQPTGPSGWMNKYFGLVGVSFYRIDTYLFTADAQIGGFKPGSNFDASLITKGVYVNVGVTVERELSEYLRVFARPSFEIKSYKLAMPAGGEPISHNINAFYLNVGISYTIPELRKCVKHDCKIQMNHAHGDREYRSRVHPIYKKQNPLYGENHPKLFKYKGKNKKKLNPY